MIGEEVGKLHRRLGWFSNFTVDKIRFKNKLDIIINCNFSE